MEKKNQNQADTSRANQNGHLDLLTTDSLIRFRGHAFLMKSQISKRCQTVATKWESYSRMIMTSVDFTKAATVWPFFRRISRIASALMMDVIR
jgi:hypothetical protein